MTDAYLIAFIATKASTLLHFPAGLTPRSHRLYVFFYFAISDNKLNK